MTIARAALTTTCILLGTANGLAAGVIGGSDVRIGAADNRIDARDSVFDVDLATGNYFAVVVWGDRWTFNISTDEGASFSRTYRLITSQGIAALDMAISGSWVYVSYATHQTSSQARMRRFSATTGVLDLHFGGPNISNILIADASPWDVGDISVESDVDSADDQLFVALIQSDGSTRFFRDELADGPDFEEVNIAANEADGGLDMNWNPGFATYSLFLSLVNQDGNIEIWRYNGAWSFSASFVYSGSQLRSSISAFADQIVVAYLAPAPHGQGVEYRQSSDGGSTWSAGRLVASPAAGTGDLFDAQISARGGLGLALVYNLDGSGADRSLFQHKNHYQPGPWTNARSFNDFDSVPGLPIAINWIPTDHYGVIYVGGGDAVPYFDLMESPAIFLDGVESGTTDSWSAMISPP